MPDPSGKVTTNWSYVFAGDRTPGPMFVVPVPRPVYPRGRYDSERLPASLLGIPHVAQSRVWTRPAATQELLQLLWEEGRDRRPLAQIYRPPSVYHQPVPDEEYELEPESLWARPATPGWVPMPAEDVLAWHNTAFDPPLPPPEVVADALLYNGSAGNINRRFGAGAPPSDEVTHWKPWLD